MSFLLTWRRASAPFALMMLLIGGSIAFGGSQSTDRSSARGPIYVPLDNWIYPALKRLSAMGFAPDAESLTMPWTREQCSILVDEAADFATRPAIKAEAPAVLKEALPLIAALHREFSLGQQAHTAAAIESLYARYLENAGEPLTDSYHFGQTFINDFGRPYGPASSTINGLSAYASYGRFSGYFRGEYQVANGNSPYSAGINQFLAEADGVPLQPAGTAQPIRKFNTLEAYVGARLGLFDVSIGKQSLWWGPDEDGSFEFSNNAEPVLLARVSQAVPVLLRGPLRLLGRIRTQFLIGELSGQRVPPHPLINAQKITFQLTENLEVGFTRTALFGGAGHPVTADSLFASFFSVSSGGSSGYGARTDPGDRRSGFDFRWRVPLLRRYLSVYSDSLADVEPNPLDSPHRSAWGPGLYLTHLPRLRHLDLRFETYSTWLYRGDEGGLFFYWNNQYRDAYTNQGNLLGSWIGRDARAYVARSTYWCSPRHTISLLYRETKIGSNFISGGGTQTDVSASANSAISPEVQALLSVQYERRFIPILGGPQRDISAQLQLTFQPHHWRVKR